jgi:hypothetical protein
MNKRLLRIIEGIIVILFLTFIMILVYDHSAHEEENQNNPALFTRYFDSGYYKIDTETILSSLETGKTEVFTPLLENPDEIEPVTTAPIRWSQADFLKIASALGEFTWDDPMDLTDWHIYYVLFRGSCDVPMGFNFGTITYFKTKTTGYETRLIEIDPGSGWVRWGNGQTYAKPILEKWNEVKLPEAKVNAENALQIASEDAKKHFQFKDYCDAWIATPQYNDGKNWYIDFMGTPGALTYSVNLETGNFTFQNPSK